MECRSLEVTVISANDLKDVNLLSKMDVYAVVSIKGDPYYTTQKQRTRLDKDCGSNPKWNQTMKFTLDEESLQNNRLALKLDIMSERILGDREIGHVHVPIKELLDIYNNNNNNEGKNPRLAGQVARNYGVRTADGKTKGSLNFSFKFGEKLPAPVASGRDKQRSVEPVMAYPYTGTSAPPPAYNAYPPGPPQGYQQPYSYPYPAAGGYPQPAAAVYGGYPPQQGYGYPSHYGYDNVYAQPAQAQQRPNKSGGSAGKMALGVGAGVLGGLLLGDMVSDVGEMASYDAGYDAGFDDGFGF